LWGTSTTIKLQIVKVEGEFVWHKHDETDDFFLVIRGHPERRFRNSTVYLHYRTRG